MVLREWVLPHAGPDGSLAEGAPLPLCVGRPQARGMSTQYADILSEAGLSAAEYAVLWQVRDTVVSPRAVLAEWTAHHGPHGEPSTVTREEALAAVASLVARGLLVELTADELARDLARWRDERYPVTVGVDLQREVGDVDLTTAGAALMASLEGRTGAPPAAPLTGYVADAEGAFRVFGETEEACLRTARGLMAAPPAEVRGFSLAPPEFTPMRPAGPWWSSRYVLVPGGFEVDLRFAR